MKKICGYRTVRTNHDSEFDSIINELINKKEGWEPYGNPYSKDSYCYQALVKYKDVIDVSKGEKLI